MLLHSNNIFDKYMMSFDAHLHLVTIHPWADGNGRMSRLIMNLLQIEFGLIPSKVNKDNKANYIQALIEARELDSVEPFRNFMLMEHVNNLQSEIEVFELSIEGGQKTKEIILRLIREDAQISSIKMAERIGINRSAISKHLKKLQEDGIIRREGPDKGGSGKS